MSPFFHFAAPGTWDDLTKGFERTVNELVPKTDEERAKEAVNNAEEDIWDAILDAISGGGDCTSDIDCNAVVGHCYIYQPSK